MSSAFMALPLATLLAASPVTAGGSPASPAPSDSPLREIGHVRVTTPFCKAALHHALEGITLVLDNDGRLTAAEAALRRLDRETNLLVVYKGQQRLLEDYVALREAVVDGRRAIGELKRVANEAPADAQKSALLSLANALDGALLRQKAFGEELASSVMRVDSYQPFAGNVQSRMMFDSIRPEGGGSASLPVRGPFVNVTNNLYPDAKRDADEIERGLPRLAADEADAATRIDGAFDPC